MAVTTTKTNKPINPRGNDQSPKGYNRAALYSGKALDFDGVNDYVSVADSDDLDGFTDFTICAIVKADTLPNYCRIISKGSDVYYVGVQYPGNGELEIYANGTRFFSEFAVKTGEYIHFAISFTGGQDVKFYQNGQLTSTQTHSISGTSTNSNNVVIGRNVNLNGNPWDGQISNAKVFDVALTAAQVSDLYNNPEKIVPTGVEDTALKLWLPMMEGAGTTAYDGSGNGNHGTISGATYVHGVGSPVSQTAVIDWNKGTNLQPYSEQLDNSAWTQQAASITANVIASPDGYQNADELVVNTSNAFHQLAAVQSVSAGTTYAFSVYAKQGSGTKYFQIAGAGLQAASQAPVFDLQNGVVYTAVTKTVCLSADIQSVGDGWYRCSLIVAATGAAGMTLCFVGATNAFSGDSFAGNGTDSFYFWGAQVEAADSLGAYIPNHTGTPITSPVLLPQGLTSGRDITGVNLFENVRKQGALNLDGNSWAEVHDNASIDLSDANASFEAWVYYDFTATSNNYIFNKLVSAGYRIRIEPGGNFGFYMSDGTTAFGDGGSFPLVADSWNHLVLTTDGTNFKRYINGSLADTDVAGTPLTTFENTDVLYIGSSQALTNYMPTQIAQPRIYNRALTAEEVERNYNAGKNIYK